LNKIIETTSSVQFIEINADQAGQRIDNFLIKSLKKLPRSRLYRIIRKGEVRVNKKRIKPEYKLCAGDSIRIPPVRLEQKDDGPLVIPGDLLKQLEGSVLYEDDNILVLDKPSGLAVHSGSGLRYGVIDALRQLRHEDDIELVHRLDRDTSGCLLLAKNRQCLRAMQKLLQAGEINKTYLAIVKGHWDKSLERLELPLKKQTMPNGEKKVFIDDNGQHAITLIESIQHLSCQSIKFSALRISLITGRTHQIRVHCQSQHHEIAGDDKYGDRKFNQSVKALGSRRLLLHAAELEIPENAHTKALKIISKIPAVFREMTLHEQ
jgi:23S rRNA pseudouridine955/2504/2580 synthase